MGGSLLFTGIVIKISNKINNKNSKKNVKTITGTKLMLQINTELLISKTPILSVYWNTLTICEIAKMQRKSFEFFTHL